MTTRVVPDRPSRLEMDASIKRKRDTSQFAGFQNAFFAELAPNDGHLREGWAEAGLLEFEFADDTGSDDGAHDEVAKDRAARAS